MATSSFRPFFFPGGTTGCLLIHGFAGFPGEMRGLGEHLAAQGYTVMGIRLAGHSENPQDMRKIRWEDWLTSADAGFHTIRQRCTHITVIGFSLGGALALMLAWAYDFERLVLLSTPLKLQGDWRVYLLPLLRHVVPWYYPLQEADFNDPFVQKRLHDFAPPDTDLSDPVVQQHIRHTVRIPLGAVDELRKTLRYARRRVPLVTIPTLIMHGREDVIAPTFSAEELHQRLGSRVKELVWWDNTAHHLLEVGPHREQIYQRIAAFLASLRHQR